MKRINRKLKFFAKKGQKTFSTFLNNPLSINPISPALRMGGQEKLAQKVEKTTSKINKKLIPLILPP